jgi:hypothetical protein
MSTPTEVALRFRRNVRGEILRLLNHHHLARISREEVEKVGKDCGLSSGEATDEFLLLRACLAVHENNQIISAAMTTIAR